MWYPLDSLQIPQWHAEQSPWALRRSVPYYNCCYVVWISWKKSQLSSWKPSSYNNSLPDPFLRFFFRFFYFSSKHEKIIVLYALTLLLLVARQYNFFTSSFSFENIRFNNYNFFSLLFFNFNMSHTQLSTIIYFFIYTGNIWMIISFFLVSCLMDGIFYPQILGFFLHLNNSWIFTSFFKHSRISFFWKENFKLCEKFSSL